MTAAVLLLLVSGATVAFVVALVVLGELRARSVEWRECELRRLYREAVLEAAALDGLEPEDERELADVPRARAKLVESCRLPRCD